MNGVNAGISVKRSDVETCWFSSFFYYRYLLEMKVIMRFLEKIFYFTLYPQTKSYAKQNIKTLLAMLA